jgi:uncharacterized protein (DUF433 family)
VTSGKGAATDGQISVTAGQLLHRITADPRIHGGKPVVRGLRITVEMVLALLAAGETVATILDDYPELEPDDLRACIAYAHAVIAGASIEEVQVGLLPRGAGQRTPP